MTRKPAIKEAYPEIFSSLDPDKNEDVKVDTITAGSNKKLWWICDKGHSYQLQVYFRVEGTGCPYCSGKQAYPGYNDLATLRPEIAREWHPSKNLPLTPDRVRPGAGKKVWWVCSEGHEYQNTVDNRCGKGAQCPYCSGRRIMVGFNDLGSQRPDVASMWDQEKNGDLTPQEITLGSGKKVWFRCSAGEHSYQTTVPEMIRQLKIPGRTDCCPYCKNKKVVVGYNDLATTHPQLAQQWHPTKNGDLTPQDVVRGTQHNTWWICEEGHEWNANILGRSNGIGCKKCNLTGSSRSELEVFHYVQSILPDLEVISGDRKLIKPYEVDIYIPEKKIAIEFNGIYWHSEKYIDRDYHQKKWKMCADRGVQLIAIWEDEWRDKRGLVEKMLSHKLGVAGDDKVFARKTRVVEVSGGVARDFADQHHIQGSCRGSAYLGLEDKVTGEIVSVVILRKVKDTLYIDRYCTSKHVVGGFGKLLPGIVEVARDAGCGEIVTFADHRVSDGSLYDRVGFALDSVLDPDYCYVTPDLYKHHKFGYRLARFRSDPDLVYREGLSERQLAGLNGLLRLWDYGKSRYVLSV